MRTAKSCGPDASTLASSLRNSSQATVTKEPITGESPKETVKTIAQGRPGCSRWTCMLVCEFLCILHTRPRVQRAPGLPCALSLQRAKNSSWLGRVVPREREGMFFVRARSVCDEAIRSDMARHGSLRGVYRRARIRATGWLAITVGDGRPSLGRLRRPADPRVGAWNPQEVPLVILTLSSQGSRNVPATMERMVRAARGRSAASFRRCSSALWACSNIDLTPSD